jgi:chromosomal replication initiation ATPase DnaA
MPRRTSNRDDDPVRMRLCLAATALEFGMDDQDIATPKRRGPLVDLARQVAMRLAHTSFGMTHTRIGALIGRDRTTVRHGCDVVEDECDDPIFAARIERLETVLSPFITDGKGQYEP